MNLFREINATGTTVLVATHDRELIRHVGRRAIMLDHGRVVETDMTSGRRRVIAGLKYFVARGGRSASGAGAVRASCRS